MVAAGGHPAALRRPTTTQRTRWFSSYSATVADRDLPALIEVRNPGALSRLYRLVAQRTSATGVSAELAHAPEVSPPTLAAYRRLLERIYLTIELPAGRSASRRRPGTDPSSTSPTPSSPRVRSRCRHIGSRRRHLAARSSSRSCSDGRVVAIEVKSARSVNQSDAGGLVFLRERLGDRLECGIQFHTGPLTARFGDRICAVPVAALWDWRLLGRGHRSMN